MSYPSELEVGPQRLLAEFGRLLDSSQRRTAAVALARWMGADDLILFVRDPELDVLLPALGFPQTLPQGRILRTLVERARREGCVQGQVFDPADGTPVAATACCAADGSVMVLLGGKPALAIANYACQFVPFVAFSLRLERSTSKAEEHAIVAQRAAEQARTLATSLDATRRELQRAFHEAEIARRRSGFLADAATLLGSSLDYETTLEGVAKLSVNFLADWCFIHLVEEGHEVRWMTTATSEPARESFATAMRAAPGRRSIVPAIVAEVLKTSELQRIDDLTDARLHDLFAAAEGAIDQRVRSCMCIPLIARERILGTILYVSTSSGRVFESSDLELAAGVAARAALAVDNARLYRDAQEAISARNDFLSMAAHELRTPLTPVKLQLESLERLLGGADLIAENVDRARVRLGSALRQTEHMSRLIDNLLDISRLTVGRLDLRLEPVDLSAVVESVVARFADTVHNGRIEVRVITPGPVEGAWDRFRLEQVVTNHLTNAIKYGEGRPVEIEVRATDELAVLLVKDHGIGIPPENQTKIFRQFERANAARAYSGFGLGLWIVRQVVEALQGTVRVDSEVGVGSTFTVTLPRRRDTSPRPFRQNDLNVS